MSEQIFVFLKNQSNCCFLGLQVLNLIGVVSNAPLSLIILAPNLVELKLECIKPKLLFKVKEFGCLKCLELVSLNPFSVIGMLRSSRTVKMLTVDIQRGIDSVASKLSLGTLFDCFPNLRSLKLGSGAWLGMEALFCAGGLEGGCTNFSDVSLLIHRKVDSSIASKFVSKYRVNWPRVRWRWGTWEEGTEDNWVSDAC
ncbi:hypothetical protein UlMin_010482 [Ulmus minor]